VRVVAAGERGLRFADTAVSYYEREPRGGLAHNAKSYSASAVTVAEVLAHARS